MKKSLITVAICGIAALSGCQNNNDDNSKAGIYKRSGNTINVNDNRAELYNEGHNDVTEDFGYTRHQRSPVQGENTSNKHYASIDREKMSDIIGKYATDVPNVDDVSTLVTDEEVLIIYSTDTKDRSKTADQVKRTAMSVVPRWYHVYVSDNPNLRKDVESYAQLDSDSKNVDAAIDRIIQQMQKSPQGKKMNNGENANGEEANEK
ncbi:YhcN/YlaJ family sporulation lipoprotein [Bacillus massilinigeriensis]|uniref:YhcN/YlaJ family sporulation lipoprotein n=1 Tax=Bacillus massilionigeriensis TaxID=1805475 RepID=UPI00096B544D|nr:YhcN/YlaJ family sporulation lipoprotein [Bacillus massilionigeriensis]